MKYTDAFFDRGCERRGTNCTKWDGCNEKFGVDPGVEMIPMWIADMDFESPAEVQETILKRAKAGCYGYSMRSDSFYRAILGWVSRRYHWEIQKDWVFVTPGVIPGFHIAIQNFTEPGDGIIVQPPVYYPFMDGIKANDRKLVFNPLIEKDGHWTIDFDDLEQKAKDPDNKMMIFCSPHNPVGRVWIEEELRRLSRICAENGVLLLSDEIHADLVMKGAEHHATCAAAPEYKNNVITFYAPSKTFNLAGLQTACVIVPDPEKRVVYQKGLNANRIFNVNWFGAAALETAWTKCDDYVDALLPYIDANMDYMVNFLKEELPMLKMEKPEGTYMTWVDFRGTGMSTEEIERFITEKAHIGVDMGSWFGPGGAGYLRFNLACPRAILEKALVQLKEALLARC